MFIDLSQYSVYLAPGATDMRKQMASLAVLVQEQLQQNPFSKSLFLFCNRKRNLLKILYWDRNGFCVWAKRLETHQFPWPQSKKQAVQLDLAQLQMLLSGIDFFHAHDSVTYESVG
jgi:transposase